MTAATGLDLDWTLECTACGATRNAEGLPGVCECGEPWLVRYPSRPQTIVDRTELRRRHGMWRFRSWLPIMPEEEPVSLGEGDTPLVQVRRAGTALGFSDLWIKDESANPTGSFKARGLSAAVTRAAAAGATGFVLPTAGNAGVAAAAYGARAGLPVRVYAPRSTPATIVAQMRTFGADLVLLDGHIGDCGKASRAFAAETGFVDLSTLREPYRIEGKKTLGLEVALAFNWKLPDALVYPTGGGTGLIAMWKAFGELLAAGWVTGPLPRMYSVQAAGCAPVVRAFDAGDSRCEPWDSPWTLASGLRVPAPLGGRLMLEALRASDGGAMAVRDELLARIAADVSRSEGIDISPEGGAALAGAALLREAGAIHPDERVVVFNTGAGWLYRPEAELPEG
ncbi:MAG TPA: threonine synthase [Gemmatimonadales bacterium]|nr:threonine synthase [Gemmatimonadales bacterium]